MGTFLLNLFRTFIVRTRLYQLIFATGLVLCSFFSSATIYYVSTSGNDSNPGNSSSKPWKTLAKVNSFRAFPGDQILFKKGDSWEGTLIPASSGSSGSPITYGSYGTGEKPKIYGSKIVTGWTLHSRNIYKASYSGNVEQVFLDGERQMLARSPNSGYYNITSVSSSTQFTSSDLNGGFNYIGATWVGKTSAFYMYDQPVVGQSSQTLTLDAAPRSGGLGVDEGFFLCDQLIHLDQAGEWFHDTSTNTLYVWTPDGTSPSRYTVRASIESYGIHISYKNYITIQNIDIYHSADKGIYADNCDFVTIEGCCTMYPDLAGIYLPNNNSTDLTITNCIIDGANGNGIRASSDGAVIMDNVIKNTGQFYSINKTTYRDRDNFGTGLFTRGRDHSMMYNKILHSGYCGINWRGEDASIKYNFIDGAMEVLDDGGGIYTYNSPNDYTKPGAAGSEISNNIVLDVHGNTEGYEKTFVGGYGIYMDNNTHDVLIENNTVANTSCGIVLHENGKIKVENNTVMDAMMAILTIKEVENSTFTNNIVYSTKRIGDFKWWQDSFQKMVYQEGATSIFDYNTYVNFYQSTGIFRLIGDGTFDAWRRKTGQDQHSTFQGAALAANEVEELFFNDTKQTKSINLGNANYKDLKGEMVSGTLTLQPFTSKLLINTKSGNGSSNSSPSIQDQSFELQGAQQKNDFVGKVIANDPDQGQLLNYSIIQGNEENLFSIHSTTGEILVNNSISVTENVSFNLIVEVTDNDVKPLSASSTVTINVINVEASPITSTPTYGNTEVYGATSINNSRRALPVTFSEDGDIASISIYHNGGSGKLLLAVYSDQGETPSSLQGTTAPTFINSTEGWQTVPLTSPVTVTSGQTVWLAWVFENNPGIRYASGSPGRAQSSNTWSGGMPATFGAASFSDSQYSIYCSNAQSNTDNTKSTITDNTKPTITDFIIPATYASLTIPVSKFTAADNTAVTGFLLTESSGIPSVNDNGWVSSAPNSYTVSETGTRTLYAWVKDAAGNVSASSSAQVVITLVSTTAFTFGNTEVYGSTSTNNSRRALPVTFSENGDITNISIYHNGGSGDLLLGVYSGQSGAPSSLLGVTASTPIKSTEGWQTVPLSSPVTVASGQTVWLAWVFENNPGIRYASGAPGRAQSSDLWSAGMPTTFGAANYADYQYSIYCSYNTKPTITDNTKPVITDFTIPATYASLTIPVSNFTATDNIAVNGFLLTESSETPSENDNGWVSSAPSLYTVSGTGSKTLYAWVKDAAGNVSARSSAQVVITLASTPALTLGNTEVYGATSINNSRRALPVTFSEDGVITSISIYHNGGYGDLLLGVYSGLSGAPSSLLGVTASTPIKSTEGWQTVPLSSPATVSSGQTVWLAWVFENNPGIRYTSGAPGRAQSSNLWSAGMPTTFGAASYANYQYSIYCSYTDSQGVKEKSGEMPNEVTQIEQNQMFISVTAAFIDGIALQAGDKIEVYDGNLSIGSVLLTESIDSTNTNSYAEIILNKDNGSGIGFTENSLISIKIWDSSKQEEKIVENIRFKDNLSTWNTSGTFIAGSYSFVSIGSPNENKDSIHSQPEIETQSIVLSKGWNIFSTYLIPSDLGMDKVLEELYNKGQLIEVEDEKGNTYKNEGDNLGWINNIGDISNSKGYKVRVNSDCILEVTGQPVSLPLDFELKKGWNIISVPYNATISAMEFIQPLIEAGILEKVQDEKGNSIEYWESVGWIDRIGSFEAGKGYKVLVNNAGFLPIITEYEKSAGSVPEVAETTYYRINFNGNGLDHMNVNVSDLSETILQVGDEIAVFDGEICVGAIKLTEDHFKNDMVGINASFSGDEMESGFVEMNSIELRILYSESNIESQQQPNIVLGNMIFQRQSSVFVQLIDQNAVTTSEFDLLEISLYPNPATERVNMRFSLFPETGTRIELRDIAGKQLLVREVLSAQEVLDIQDLPNGIYIIETVWGNNRKVNKLIKK